MKKFLIILLLGLCPLLSEGQTKKSKLLAENCGGRCTGSEYCSACKNCSRCAHCSNGGTCGVCEPRKSNTVYSGQKNKKVSKKKRTK